MDSINKLVNNTAETLILLGHGNFKSIQLCSRIG